MSTVQHRGPANGALTTVPQQSGQLTAQGEALVSRSAQEVQAALVIAKRFPRDEIAAYERIMKACERPKLAAQAIYAYPKGGQKVEGPSIRLAEALAQHWGNIDFGISELENDGQESSVMAHAWDLETNTRRTMTFSIPHVRHTKKGDYQLSDPREVYENMANNAARRLRACILAIIPGDIADAAVNKCEETLRKGGGKPLSDRIRDMVMVFGKLGVTREQIEKRLGHKIEACSEHDIAGMTKVYKTLADGFSAIEDFFPKEEPTASSAPAPQQPPSPSEHKQNDPASAPAATNPATTGPKTPPGDLPANPEKIMKITALIREKGLTEKDVQKLFLKPRSIKALVQLTDNQAEIVLIELADMPAPRQPGEEG